MKWQTREKISKAVRGEGGRNKITEAQAIEIRARFDAGEKSKDIAEDYPISTQQVYQIGTRVRWTYLL